MIDRALVGKHCGWGAVMMLGIAISRMPRQWFALTRARRGKGRGSAAATIIAGDDAGI